MSQNSGQQFVKYTGRAFSVQVEQNDSKHNTLPNVDSVLVHSLRRWPNIEPTLGQFIVIDVIDNVGIP